MGDYWGRTGVGPVVGLCRGGAGVEAGIGQQLLPCGSSTEMADFSFVLGVLLSCCCACACCPARSVLHLLSCTCCPAHDVLRMMSCGCCLAPAAPYSDEMGDFIVGNETVDKRRERRDARVAMAAGLSTDAVAVGACPVLCHIVPCCNACCVLWFSRECARLQTQPTHQPASCLRIG